jgi:hypothetical protein
LGLLRNVTPLDTHGRDRSALDETSYPSTNLLSILYYLVGPLYSKISVSLLSWVIPGRSIWKVYTRLLSFTQHKPFWAFSPFSHRMRDNPFLGQYTLKFQEMRKWRGTMMKSGKYGRERYDGSLREFPVTNPSPRKTTY